MPNKQIISASQLLTMIVLFEFGTALVVPIGLQAEQGVWISVLLAMPGGVVLYLLFDNLSRRYPNLTLSGYMRKIFGRYIAWPVNLMYVGFFIYIASRNLRDAGGLLVSASYDQTPPLMIHAAMIAAVVYVLHKGIEVLFRLAQIYFIIMLSLGLIGNAAILFSGCMDIRNLLPLSRKGWGSIVLAAYPYIFLFPFAELICFTAVLPHLNKIQLARKAGVTGIVISGTLLSMTHAVQLAVLGTDIYSRATFPLLTTISLVNIADFLQRLDAIVILTLIIGVFFKMSMFCYAAMAVASDVFNVPEQRKLAIPIGTVVLFMSILLAWSFPEHIEEGAANLRVFLPLFACIIPVLLLITDLIRDRFSLKG